MYSEILTVRALNQAHQNDDFNMWDCQNFSFLIGLLVLHVVFGDVDGGVFIVNYIVLY